MVSRWTPEDDDAIRAAYRTQRFPMAWLAKQKMFAGRATAEQLRGRARSLGMRVQFKQSSQVMAIIEEHVGSRSAADIASLINRKTKRSKTSPWYVTAEDVHRWACARGWSCQPDRMSLCELARIFCVDTKKVRKWISEGKLRAKRDETSPDTGDWRIKPIDLVRFMRENPWDLDGGFFDVPWLMALFEELWVQCSANMNGKTKNGGGNGKKNRSDREADGEGED